VGHCTPPQTHPDRPRLSIADIVARHGGELTGLSSEQHRVLAAITACRTEALGGHCSECDHCGHQDISYNSCRNRHCPTCGGSAELDWISRRQQDLLPVEYHHAVFTISAHLHDLFLYNPKLAYGFLFAAASETLQEAAGEPRWLGARIGLMAILHTWTQKLLYHPHLHCIVPGGGLSEDGSRWVPTRPGFLFPVRALSEMFRGKLLFKLQTALKNGELVVPPGPITPERALKRAARQKWNVYSKPSLAGPEHVIAYLGRYVHRIAISNERILHYEDGKVTFRYKDRADGDRQKTETLEATTFLRRFLLHVLPHGFVRIRYFGLLAHARRRAALEQCRRLLGVTVPASPAPDEQAARERLQALVGVDRTVCKLCSQGRLRIVEILPSAKRGRSWPARAPPT